MFFNDTAVKHRHIHFVGIGGIGMSGLAEILLNLGYQVSGSDTRSSPITVRLQSLGARVAQGHAAENISGADAVVVSSAIPESNPEREAARRREIPIIQRGELLAELMRLKYGIAIAGSHGKTTTTSMTAAVLHHAQKDPTVIVGGRVDSMGSNARFGKSDLLLAEADESDGSFLKLAPIQAVITSIDREHMEYYQSFGALRDAFLQFASKVPFYGSVILNLDDPVVREIAQEIPKPLRTYGSDPAADLVVAGIEGDRSGSRFRLAYRGTDLGKFAIRSFGRHNVANAMAAVLVGLELDIPAGVIREGLAAFSGVDHRFQIRGQQAGVTVVDDYGHHPTEIAATLAAARTCEFERVLVVFQPHRYTRTQDLLKEFASCFGSCEKLYVTDIYSAGEDPIEGVTAEALVEAIRAASHPSARYVPSIQEAVSAAVADAESGDAILTLGAGSISRAGPMLLDALMSKAPNVARAG